MLSNLLCQSVGLASDLRSFALQSTSIFYLTDFLLKMEADKKAYEKFEKGKAKTTVEAKPKEGVTSERFESKYWWELCV